MKYTYLPIICLFIVQLLISCESDKKLNPRKALITGNITNFDKYSNKNWIEIMHPDLFSQEAPFKQIEIARDGSFQYETELVSPSLCWGIYNKWFPFVLSPGDSLHFSIDANIWNEKLPSEVEKGKFISISGNVKDDYKSIVGFQNWASEVIYTSEKSKEINNAIVTKSPKEFMAFIQIKEKEILKHIKKFGTNEHSEPLFYNILDAEIKYRSLDNLMRYYLLNSLNRVNAFNEIVLPQDYKVLLETYQKDDRDFFVQNRIDFIQGLQFYLALQNRTERPTFLDIYKHKEKANMNDDYYKNQATYICSQTKGITRDLCLHYFALYNLDQFPSMAKVISESVSDLIKDPYVKMHFTEHFNSKLEKMNPVSEKINTNEFTSLDSLIDKFPGKVIYVDFWAPWCGPCMDEMPHSLKLKESYHGKDIIFVYVACNCTEKSWEATIANENMKGENILLSNNDYEILKHRFEISGIPHYLLINKKGEVINKNAPHPSDERIKFEITKLL